MAPPVKQTDPINISAKSAGTFLAAFIIAVGSYIATTGSGGESGSSNPTRAELDALAANVQRLRETVAENSAAIERHSEYSDGKVLEIEGRFRHLETWEVEHEKRENFQDQMISDCIRSLRGIQ